MFKNIKLKKALIGAGLGVLGVGTIVGTTWSINHFISKKQNVDDIDDLSPGTPLIDGVEAGANDAVHEMPKQITFTRYAKQASSDNTLTVSCTVLPANTYNKKLTWTLQWSDGGNHGTVTDYVKMTVNSDTSQCTIQSLKEWTYKIKLVVKTTDGSNLSKECTLDYLGRKATFTDQKLSTVYTYTNIYDLMNKFKTVSYGTLSGGTITGNIVVDDVCMSFDDCGGTYDDMNAGTTLSNMVLNSSDTLSSFIDKAFGFYHPYKSDVNFTNARQLYDYIDSEGCGYIFIKYHLAYNGTTYSSSDFWTRVGSYNFDVSKALTATSLTLNDTSFIF